jgi:hypothetical protein
VLTVPERDIPAMYRSERGSAMQDEDHVYENDIGTKRCEVSNGVTEMIPHFCRNPTCPIIETCQRKFKPIPHFARKDRCLHRPLPFVPLRMETPEGMAISTDLARMAREEYAMRISANEQGD